MKLIKKILKLFKKKEKIKEEVKEKPEKIILSSIPGLPDVLQAQTEIIIEDEGVDIEEEKDNE